jgi:16S rRNA (cytosine1402-N4)-methyltransferase
VSELGHTPVLMREVLSALSPVAGDVAVDCTAGHGGHASAVAERLGPTGTMVLLDMDAGNLAIAQRRVESVAGGPRVLAFNESFAGVASLMNRLGLRANVVLADLGFASSQVDDASRGLSFSRDGPLDMRLDPRGPITAAMLVNTSGEAELERVIREFGEERLSRAIARKIVAARREGAIETTGRLAEIVRSAFPAGAKHMMGIDPATRTFQALRIAVNDELGHLDALMEAFERGARSALASGSGAGDAGPGAWLAGGARVAVITFHSLEDRPVKQRLSAVVRQGMLEFVGDQPTSADEAEVRANPRARSAKLRAARVRGG